MGTFGIGTNVNKINSGIIRGKIYPIACMAWYAPDHVPRPLKFKYEGEDGVLQTIDNISIKSTDYKFYDGTAANEYQCEAIISDKRYGFKLIFYVIDNRWVMVI